MTAEPPRVLFVSKPIAPPWHDGSKNLVRDVVCSLTYAKPTVLTVPGARNLGARIQMEAVYRDRGRFTPNIGANARVMLRLLTGDPQDIWHFVFAPNPLSGAAANMAKRIWRARGWKGCVIQTVASAPRRFDTAARWMFGDVIVALSEWTRCRLRDVGIPETRLRLIPPCAVPLTSVDSDECVEVRRRYALGEGPVVLYPGDIETSSGATTVGRAIPLLLQAIPDAHIVFACRPKTSRALHASETLKATLDGWQDSVRFVGEVDDMPALLAVSQVIAFPVDDLFGKVDLPLILLEALAMGVPMVLARGGPLEDIPSGAFVDPGDHHALARLLIDLIRDERRRTLQIAQGQSLYATRFAPVVVAQAYDALYADLIGPPPMGSS